MTAYVAHPLAEVFPLLDGEQLSDLADDIKQNGLMSPIVLHEGKILDGRNRYAACKIAGVEGKFQKFDGPDPLKYIVSLNLHRRHLSESQRGMVAAKIANIKNGEVGKGHDRSGTQICAPDSQRVSQPEAAAMMNVSPRLVQDAKRIMREAPEKAKEIERGEKTIGKVMKEMTRKTDSCGNAKEVKPTMKNKEGRSRPIGNLPLELKSKIAALRLEIEILNKRKWTCVNKEQVRKEIAILLTLF